MFRDKTKAAMDAKHFGVGSTIHTHRTTPEYLLVGEGTSIRVVNLETMVFVGPAVEVEDLNFLTEKEARKVVDNTVGNDLQFTFTDFTLDPKGLKRV